MRAMDEYNKQAVDMLFSDTFRQAFDLSKESQKVRDRFGRHAWGQRALLARRLVEAGARFVTVVLENPYVSGIKMPEYGTYNWDNFQFLVGVENFTDEEPPYVPAISSNTSNVYDFLGTFYSFKLKYSL